MYRVVFEFHVAWHNPVIAKVMRLRLNFLAIFPYSWIMNDLRHIMIALASLVIALPCSVFATCCCSANGSSQCCTPTYKESRCCCGTSQPTGEACCLSTSGNQYGSECKCSVDEFYDANFLSERENDDYVSVISSPLYEVFPFISSLRKEFHSFAFRPPSHNRRQAMLCVWLK